MVYLKDMVEPAKGLQTLIHLSYDTVMGTLQWNADYQKQNVGDLPS